MMTRTEMIEILESIARDEPEGASNPLRDSPAVAQDRLQRLGVGGDLRSLVRPAK
jgi:hypothetical protein